MRRILLALGATAIVGCSPVHASPPDSPPADVAAMVPDIISPRPSVTEAERDRVPSFPGGGRILYMPGSSTGYIQGIGVVWPDGRSLTFRATKETFPYWDPDANADLLTIESDSPRQHAVSYRITGDELRRVDSWRLDGGVFAVFSPDGRWIAEPAFNGRGRMREGVIRLVDRETGEASRLRTGFTPLGWSPDGRLIAEPTGGGGIVLWTPGTGRTTELSTSSRFVLGEIMWSPDGSKFATRVSYGIDDSKHGISIGRTGGDLAVVSTFGRRWIELPTWSPDGRQIAFLVRGDGRTGHRHSELVVYDLETAIGTVVADDVSDAFWASWSPDGKWLLVDDWTRHRWLFVAADGSERIPYPRLGHFPRWCCPSSPPIDVPIPVC